MSIKNKTYFSSIFISNYSLLFLIVLIVIDFIILFFFLISDFVVIEFLSRFFINDSLERKRESVLFNAMKVLKHFIDQPEQGFFALLLFYTVNQMIRNFYNINKMHPIIYETK